MNGNFLEFEMLGSIIKLNPDNAVEHVENGMLTCINLPLTEDKNTIEKILTPILSSFLDNKK